MFNRFKDHPLICHFLMYIIKKFMQNQGSKYKIFNHRPGIDISQIPQGRNVQPFPFHKKL